GLRQGRAFLRRRASGAAGVAADAAGVAESGGERRASGANRAAAIESGRGGEAYAGAIHRHACGGLSYIWWLSRWVSWRARGVIFRRRWLVGVGALVSRRL